jgi:mannosyltransferase OCH1-like enzyme
MGERSEAARIPRVIHHVWVGSPLPDHLAGHVASWRRHHPGWEHILWRDADLGWLRHKDEFARASSTVPPDAVGQLRADIARYEILERHGGLYVDCDTEALRPVDDALAGVDAWAAAEDTHWIGNTYLAAMPGHPVMAALVDGLAASIRRQHGHRPNRMTGPRYLTPIWRAHGCTVGPTARWFPYSYRHVKAGAIPTDWGDAYAVHHWQHTRDTIPRETHA